MEPGQSDGEMTTLFRGPVDLPGSSLVCITQLQVGYKTLKMLQINICQSSIWDEVTLQTSQEHVHLHSKKSVHVKKEKKEKK